MPTIDHELQHEEAMIQQGIASYRNQYSHLMSQNRLSDTRPGSRLLKGSVFDLAQDIERHLTNAMTGKPGRHNKAASLMVTLDAGVMAYCTVKGLVNALTKPTPITRVAKMVATLLEDQVRFTAFKKAEPSTFYHLIEEYKRRTGHPTYKRASLSGHMDRLNFEWHPWPMDVKIHVGLTLVELAIQATGMATIKDRKEKGKSQKLVVPTEKTLAWIRDFNTYHEALGPHYLPMLVEPKPWTGPKEGGYYLPTLEMPIVKGAKSGQLHHYDTMPLVYQALNTLQQSSWRINPQTLAIMHEVWENNRSLGKLPTKAPMPVPPCPLPRELNQKQMNKVQQELFEQWKFQASQIHNRNAELNGKRIQVELTLQTARKMSQHPRFWFPYNLDFRGRIYAIPGLLNPQGSDWAKGLLLF